MPHGEAAAELSAICRATNEPRATNERASRDERRLRVDLITTFPAALIIAGDDIGAPTLLRMLERWSTARNLAEASRDEFVAFARAGRHGWPDRFGDRIRAALAADNFVARDWLVRANVLGRQRPATDSR